MDKDLEFVQRRLNDVRHNLAILLNSDVCVEVLDKCDELLNEADRKIDEIKKTNHTSDQLSN